MIVHLSAFLYTSVQIAEKGRRNTMSEITLKNVSKIYENQQYAVRNVNLEIQDKEFVILVGPSGCGKSTTLRMIAGLEDISDGELYIDGEFSNYCEPKDREMSMVFQNYALYPNMTVYGNLAYALKIRKVPKDEIKKRVHEVAKILEIEHLLDRKPSALSGGQKQRVAMGSAIIRKPKVFLMDEPLSNLDAKLRVQMRTEISKLYQQLGTTFIYVTHDQTEAMTMGTRIVVMKDGRIQQVASPAYLYNHPVNKFVAGFIGSPQMNFLNGKINEKDGAIIIELSDVSLKVESTRAKQLREKGYLGKTVIMGIRPEDISVDNDYINEHQEDCFEGKAEVVEFMGSESYIQKPFIVKAPGGTTLTNGVIGRFAYKMDKMHFFDIDSEEAIIEGE